MSNNFLRIHRSLRADRGLWSTAGIVISILLVTAWATWACVARVTRFERSDSARLEVDSADYPLAAAAAGRVAVSRLRLGETVHAGDVLLEFESDSERLSLEEERTRLAAIGPQMLALQAEIEAQADGKANERKVLGSAENGAEAQYEDATAQAKLAEAEWERAEKLRAEGIISRAEADRARTAAESKHALAESYKSALSRLQPEWQVRSQDREIKSRETLSNLAKLQAEASARTATVRRLEYEIEKRRLRAPISGRLGECAVLRPGTYINQGQKLGVILASGQLQAVADFLPSAAFGKVHPGQKAVLRLQGFPWAQYGVVQAHVSRVADEIRDGRVRVELAVNTPYPAHIPLQHGLPGSVEVEVERISPAALVLRSSGELVGAR